MPYTAEQAHKAAAKGAEWLDKKCPTWFNEINVDTLKLSDPFVCVLGQTAPCILGKPLRLFQSGYASVLRAQEVADQSAWARRLGFDVPTPTRIHMNLVSERMARYEMLQIAWLEIIRARREAQVTA